MIRGIGREKEKKVEYFKIFNFLFWMTNNIQK